MTRPLPAPTPSSTTWAISGVLFADGRESIARPDANSEPGRFNVVDQLGPRARVELEFFPGLGFAEYGWEGVPLLQIDGQMLENGNNFQWGQNESWNDLECKFLGAHQSEADHSESLLQNVPQIFARVLHVLLVALGLGPFHRRIEKLQF